MNHDNTLDLRALADRLEAEGAYITGTTLHLYGCATGRTSHGHVHPVPVAAAMEIAAKARPTPGETTPCRACLYITS